MWIHRILYVLILALSVMFFVLYPHWFAWYLLLLLLLLLPFDLIISLPGMLTRGISLSAPYVLEQGGRGALIATVLSEKPFPSGMIKISLRVKTEDGTYYRRLMCDGARGSRTWLMIDTAHSGITAFELRRVKMTSLLGFISIPVRAGRGGAGVLVLPAPLKPPRTASLPKAVILRPKPGGGFSEEHDIRPYRRGDPVNSVHWKLSAKHDSLMIREPLDPPPHSRLVRAARWNGPAERDLILGRLRWVSSWLLERGLSYYIKLGEYAAVSEVTCDNDLISFLRLSLGGADIPATTSLPPRFTWVFRVDAKEVT